MIIPICPFLLDVSLHVLHQPVHTRRDPGGKPSGVRVYYPPLRFPQSILDDSGHNQGEPSPPLWATQLQLAPTQGYQKLSHTGNDVCMGSGHMRHFSVSLLTQCTQAPIDRHSSPVEVVLTGSRAVLLGLVEILKGPHWGHGAID